ncbi:MAG TPA: hypothetical protein IAC46_04530 [Candidatus Onthoplasma faecigallinarum]|nr:hypothetical protein [Candidatus Onthoplasma faecigallinarum]
MTKVNVQNWPQLDFLINNFFEIIEYKRGRGIYGDRVVLKRPKRAEAVFGEPERLQEFYYMDANAVKEFPRTILEKIKFICRFVTSPESMNVLCEFDKSNGIEPNEWAIETKKQLEDAKSLDYGVLNKILLERYKLLDSNFLSKLKKHREKQYFLASSDEFNFISKEYANQQIGIL